MAFKISRLSLIHRSAPFRKPGGQYVVPPSVWHLPCSHPPTVPKLCDICGLVAVWLYQVVILLAIKITTEAQYCVPVSVWEDYLCKVAKAE